jgi:hypothetical protein
MLGDLPVEKLRVLHKLGKVSWRDWSIRYAPRKYLQVTHIPTKRTCQLWDVIGFFQSSFESSLESWLDVKDDVIAKGKKSRNTFQAKNLEFIIAYCNTELVYFEQLMQALWLALYNAGFKLNRWDGSGAIAAFLFNSHGMAVYKGSEEDQAEHYDKARSAYAGGRFELFQPGDYEQTVYNYDINSAYPYAICQLPPFTRLEHIDNLVGYRISDYDLCYVKYNKMNGETWFNPSPGRIHPFFHRTSGQSVCYPPIREGWVWGVEVNTARSCDCEVEVTDVYHWHDNGDRPWMWVSKLFDWRKQLKAEGNSAEKAIKLGINSLYGKMVQQKGWHDGEPIPKTHQLYMGGWVTAKCRSMVFAAMQLDPNAIIAVETDGIYSTRPLPLPCGDKLGEWEVTVYESMTYCQSGMYFGTKDGKEIAKYRGLDRNTLKREAVLNAYERYGQKKKGANLKVKASATRFRTLGTSLVGTRLEEWRQWRHEKRQVDLNIQKGNKRYHNTNCGRVGKPTDRGCTWGRGVHHTTIAGTVKDTVSSPYNVLWIDQAAKEEQYLAKEEQMEDLIVDF